MRATGPSDVTIERSGVRIRDLGPIVVEAGGTTTELGATKQAALLSLLAARVNQRVSADDLVAAAWGLDGAVSLSSLDSQLWRLRNLLEPTRSRTSSVLGRAGGGYRLNLGDDEVDSRRFERLAAAVTSRSRAGDSEATLSEIDQALALWRGDPFEAVVDDTATAPVAAQWQQLRDGLAERRIDVLLAVDAAERALVDLDPLIAQNPLRERLWWQRMTALARLHRAEEALATYRRLVELLRDELGLDPSPELRQLQGRILARDPTLAGPIATGSPSRLRGPIDVEEARSPAVEQQPVLAPADRGSSNDSSEPAGRSPIVHLPRRGARLVGRDADLARLASLVVQQPSVTITGTGGSGKTRLALEVAASVVEDFPDGVWFVDLAAVSEPQQVIDVVMTTLELGATQVVDPLRALRDFAGNRRILFVLDNCEHVLDGVAEVVEELLLAATDAGYGPAVLATSREPIGLDGEQLWTISPLSLLSVPPDWPDGVYGSEVGSPAVQLFVDRARAADPQLVLDPEALALVAQICRSLDGLPLAIELAAARVRYFSLAEIAEQARGDPSRLSRIGRARADHRQSLYDAIEWSYRLIPPREQALHRRLSVLPGAFTVAAARAVAGNGEVDTYEVRDTLLGLAHRSLLDVRESSRSPSATLAQLDTVRSHAHRQLVAAGELDETLDRRDRWVAALLERRPRLGRPEAPDWYDEVEQSYPVVRAALQRAVGPAGSPQLVAHGSGLAFFWYFRSRMIEGCRWLEAAQAAGRVPAGSVDELVTNLRLAGAFMLRFRPDLARAPLAMALERLADVPTEARIVVAEALVSAAGGAWACTAYELLTVLSQALSALATHTDDEGVQLFAEIVSCIATLPLGHWAEARDRAERLFARSIEIDNLVAAWLSSLAACVVAAESLRPDEALAWARRVLGLHERLGSGGSKVFLETVANCLALTGDDERAVRVYSAARAHARQAGSGWPEHPRTTELYDRVRSRMDGAAFDRAWAAGERLSIRALADWSSEPAAP
ncbi:MAG: BTAD domain-containing putative transcriptional regulator [Propionibacteriaceae bacterium]